MLAVGGFLLVEAFTYISLFISWEIKCDDGLAPDNPQAAGCAGLGDELGVTLWTGLAFSLFSTFFFVRKPRHSHVQDPGCG